MFQSLPQVSIPGHQPNKYLSISERHTLSSKWFFPFHCETHSLHQRGAVQPRAPWDCFPIRDIIPRAAYLCKMPGGPQREKENTHTALTSSSLCLARLVVLSLAFAVIPSLSPSKFQSTPLPEAPIYLNRWDQNFCTSQSAVAAEPAYKAILLQVSIKHTQRGISGCEGARATQQPFLELRRWQSQKQRPATLWLS